MEMKGLALVLSCMFIISVVSHSVLAVEDEYWTTYVNERMGYSIKYPIDWTVRIVAEDSISAGRMTRQTVAFISPEWVYVTVEVAEYEPGMSIGEIASSIIASGHREDREIESSPPRDKVIDGLPALSFEMKRSESTPYPELVNVVARDRFAYIIKHLITDGYNSVEIYQTMIASFGFLVE